MAETSKAALGAYRSPDLHFEQRGGTLGEHHVATLAAKALASVAGLPGGDAARTTVMRNDLLAKSWLHVTAIGSVVTFVQCSGVNTPNISSETVAGGTEGGEGMMDSGAASDVEGAPDHGAAPVMDVVDGPDATTTQSDLDAAAYIENDSSGTDISEVSADASRTYEVGAADGGVVCATGMGGTTANVITSDFEAGGSPGTGGWTGFAGCTFSVVSTAAHCGSHSGVCTNRTSLFQGPAVDLPPTPATYVVWAWALQNGANDAALLLNAKLACAGPGGSIGIQYPPASGVATAPPNTWMLLAGILTVPVGCLSVQLYLDQMDTSPPVVWSRLPDLFIDDVHVNRQ